jgi:7,8-dihydropterin-6-yl-methyl-4-(beta-D-ribofuranosyl)aminobenzene 5'-phosphate synthase
MKKEMNRRDFLRATAFTGTVLLIGDFHQKNVLAQEIVKIPEAEKIVITVITDNLADATRPHYKIARRPVGINSMLDGAMHAEHGLSYHIETVLSGQSHFCLFDFASEIGGVKRNIQLMNIDFKKLEAMALSHDHWDHQAALVELLKTKRDEISRGIPFFVGEQFFMGTYAKRPDGRIQSLLALKREEIENLGIVKIMETKGAVPIIPGAYFTGRVEQVTDYEKISPVFVAKRGDNFVQEEFVGEQAVVLNAKGKGLVVLSGCAHRGIVNTV